MFVLYGELIKKDIRTSRSTGNEYAIFNLLDNNKEYEFVGFKDTCVTIKNANLHDFLITEGNIESESREGKNGAKFLSYKLIANKVSTLCNQESKNSLVNNNDTSSTTTSNNMDLVPF